MAESTKSAGTEDIKQANLFHLVSHGKALLDGLVAPISLQAFMLSPLTVLCAEPGMGKTYVSELLAAAAQERGIRTVRYTLDGVSGAQACRKLTRIAHDMAHTRTQDPVQGQEGSSRFAQKQETPQGEAKTIVLIDGVTPPDEGEVIRERRAIKRLLESGCYVVLCLRPESEQLLDALPMAHVLRCDDLLFRTHERCSANYLLTGGVPLLVEALHHDRMTGAPALGFGTHYTEALERMVRSMLRPTLCDEELRLRLAMGLMGHGTVSELTTLCDRCDDEQLMWFERDAPLLGVDTKERTFSCRGLDNDEVFACCASAFQAMAANEPALVVRACSILCARGDMMRGAMVCKLCASEYDYATLGSRWGAAFVQVGETRLVSEALAASKRVGASVGVRGVLAEAALASVMGTAKEVELSKERLETIGVESTLEVRLHRQVRTMIAGRDLCRNPQLGFVDITTEAEDHKGATAIDHLRVLRLLLDGHFEQAYATLANEVMLQGVKSLPDALLALDLYVAATLSGGALDAREKALLEDARTMLARMPLSRLRRYAAALESLSQVLMGAAPTSAELEDAIAQAERAGDTLLQVVFLVAAAAGDLRVRALSRSRVRARYASELARTAGAEYLASSAELVCALALELLGEGGALEKYCLRKGRPRDLQMLAQLAMRAAGETLGGILCPEIALGTPCPRDAFWALNLIASDCGGLSDEARRLMPGSWSELLTIVRLRQMAPDESSFGNELVVLPGTRQERKPTPLSQGEQTEMVPFVASGQRVRIQVLGGFEARLDGDVLPRRRFERRRAQDLVELLAIAPNHRLRRFQAMAALWPDEDYYRGPRKLYEATGELRKVLGGLSSGINAVVADRAQGSVGFDRALVSCDIDDFEREAHLTLAEDHDDYWVLDHARQMCHLYADGPDDHIRALGDEAVGRLQELEALFVDGLVAAAEAALRLGKARLAVRYATDAHRLRDLREDAVIVLVQSLRTAGRSFEVRELYQRFARHLMEARGVFPSLALRQAVERAIGDEPDVLSA